MHAVTFQLDRFGRQAPPPKVRIGIRKAPFGRPMFAIAHSLAANHRLDTDADRCKHAQRRDLLLYAHHRYIDNIIH